MQRILSQPDINSEPQVTTERSAEWVLRSDSFDCWVLDEWRRVSTPEWRRILRESIDKRDSKREAYARWMLRDILLDSEYQEPGP